jgi:Uncharacterized protein conserved in bacteria
MRHHDKARLRRAATAAIAGALLLAGPAMAQDQAARGSGKLPEAFQGLGVDSGEPIQFEAESLEVREAESVAVFSGKVVARQNQTVLKSEKLVVYYLGTPGEGAQQVKRIEAVGDVLVTSGAQTASGDAAVFDTAAETIVVTGNVVLTQGENIIRGPKLRIDIASGQARMEGGRVQMLIEPKSLQNKTN